MADEPSLGELARRLDRVERDVDEAEVRLRAEHTSDIQRLEREHDEAFRQLREDVIKPMQDRLRMSFGRWVGVLSTVAAFAGVVVAAWATSKGASH